MSYYQALNSLGVANILSIVGLLILALLDFRNGEIRYRYLLLMVDFSYLSAYLLLFLFIVYYKYIDKYIGGADLIIFALLVSRYGYYASFLIYFYSSIIGLIYACIFKLHKLRFIPFIFMGFIYYLKGVL